MVIPAAKINKIIQILMVKYLNKYDKTMQCYNYTKIMYVYV